MTIELPVDVLIGKHAKVNEKLHIRELIYNYLDLTNEQIYLRAKGRISKYTWKSGSSGIQAHLQKPAFNSVFNEVKNKCGFSYLERLVNEDFLSDPKDWF